MKYSEISDIIYSDNKTIDTIDASLPERVAWKILGDITDRKGWRHEWGNFDDDIKDEIFDAFVDIIASELRTIK